MKKIIAITSIILGVALVISAIYFLIQPTISRSIVNMLAILGGILAGILAAGTGIKDWVELLRSGQVSKPDVRIEISGDAPQISTGENSRNIQTGGGDYIENLEISLSLQDESFAKQVYLRNHVTEKRKKITPFLIGIVLDVSRNVFNSIYQLSDKDEDFFQRLIKALNTLVNKSLSYCEHPHSKEILPKFSLFFYGFGFGGALKAVDSIVRRLGFTSEIEIAAEPIRDLLKLAAESEELPYTPNAAELSKYWKIYRTGILAQYIDMDFTNAPLVQTLRIAHDRFMEELQQKKYQPLLLVITNGKFTDGSFSDLIEDSKAIKNSGVTVVVGYIGKNDIMPTRTLFTKENPNWEDSTKALFCCSSELDRGGKIGKAVSEIAIEKSWEVPEKAKLFVQVNQQEMLEELIDIITSPLRD